MKNICVFCGASSGISPVYAEAARQFVDTLLENNMRLIYGGGNVGLMGELAERILLRGGEVIGVIPQFLVEKEVAHTGLTDLHIVNSMSERKNLLTRLADAFVLLPGGIGSLDEFFDVITQSQLGLHNKPRGILNTAYYYDDLLKFLNHSVDEGFWNTANRDRILIKNAPGELLAALQSYNAPLVNRWEREVR